ncbi:MAG: N-acyl-D-amino-acid deacylase family protein, partial [Thermoanaerobaculia bacterium]
LRMTDEMMKRLVLLAALFLAACATAPAPAPLDLKIVNARIVDGTGAPWFRGAVGIRGDSIVQVGAVDTPALKTIDARDRVLAPGFIDLLGWSERSALIDPRLEGKVRQGVTTEITGEGHSPGPYTDAMIADMNRADPGGLQVTWKTLGEFMALLEKRGTAVNFGFFVGSSNPRSMVIGSVDRAPTEIEMQQMESIVDQAMREGALGLSTSLIYIPATFSETEEIIRLAKVAAKHGGVYFSHLRNENDFINDALDEAFRIGRDAQIPVNIWHLKIGGRRNWGSMPAIIARIEEQRSKGLDVAANIYPYIASTTGLSTLVPDWALEGGWQAFLARMKDPATRERIATESWASSFVRRERRPEDVLITRVASPEMKQFEKKRLDEIARMMDVAPIEAMLRLLESNPYSPSAIFFMMNEEDVKTALRASWVSVGADAAAVVGDAVNQGVHPRAYGTFPRIVGHYVRDEKLFSLEEAVRKITSQAASRVNLFDRGVIRVGMKADVVIFDPATIRDVATYDDPHRFSEGISDVIVNGVPVLRDGAITGALPGRVLRRQSQ